MFQHVVSSDYCAILLYNVNHQFHVWLKVFVITADRQFIKQDLVEVLQKVVEVISNISAPVNLLLAEARHGAPCIL